MKLSVVLPLSVVVSALSLGFAGPDIVRSPSVRTPVNVLAVPSEYAWISDHEILTWAASSNKPVSLVDLRTKRSKELGALSKFASPRPDRIEVAGKIALWVEPHRDPINLPVCVFDLASGFGSKWSIQVGFIHRTAPVWNGHRQQTGQDILFLWKDGYGATLATYSVPSSYPFSVQRSFDDESMVDSALWESSLGTIAPNRFAGTNCPCGPSTRPLIVTVDFSGPGLVFANHAVDLPKGSAVREAALSGGVVAWLIRTPVQHVHSASGDVTQGFQEEIWTSGTTGGESSELAVIGQSQGSLEGPAGDNSARQLRCIPGMGGFSYTKDGRLYILPR